MVRAMKAKQTCLRELRPLAIVSQTPITFVRYYISFCEKHITIFIVYSCENLL